VTVLQPETYLGGIIRNLHIRLELVELSEHLMQQRIRLGDLTLEPLKRSLNKLRAEVTSLALPQACIDRALGASLAVDFRFWAGAAVEALNALPTAQRAALYQPLCRRIAGEDGGWVVLRTGHSSMTGLGKRSRLSMLVNGISRRWTFS